MLSAPLSALLHSPRDDGLLIERRSQKLSDSSHGGGCHGGGNHGGRGTFVGLAAMFYSLLKYLLPRPCISRIGFSLLSSVIITLPTITTSTIASPAYAQDITKLGGDLTSALTGAAAIQVFAPNVTDEEARARQLGGFSIFHRNVTPELGLGPRFINSSCGGCHVNNGRGPLRITNNNLQGSTMVVKVTRRGLGPNGAPRPIPRIGLQLQNHAIGRGRPYRISLRWRKIVGKYPDGSPYELLKPRLIFRIPGIKQRSVAYSLRMTPTVMGVGLLEAVADDTLLALADPLDRDGDGISGRVNLVPNLRSGILEIGRFGFRASHPTVEQQSAAAAFFDTGLTNPLLPSPSGDAEMSSEELDRLVAYQKLAGVIPAIDQDNPDVMAGKELFQSIGCDNCHTVTLVTGRNLVAGGTLATDKTIEPELANQTFHPFTDLLLHDMGPGLADNRPEFTATGSEWRTTPLWGIRYAEGPPNANPRFLHDGRARTLEEAILWHGGEAREVKHAFMTLEKSQREQLIAFLRSL